MRLTHDEIKGIKKAFDEVFGEGKVFLFGSRTDDTKRGGDIDLYLCLVDSKKLQKKKIMFLVKLDEYLGEQKIDVVFAVDRNRPIEQVAIKEGIEL